MNYKEFFNKKRIAFIGVGPHGEMIEDIRFAHRNKAIVSVFLNRSEERTQVYTNDLLSSGIENFHWNNIDSESLMDFELIILSNEFSKRSLFLKKATTYGIQIEYSETLFFKLAPPVTIIGVAGQHGKTSISFVLYNIFKKAFQSVKDHGIYLIDCESTSGCFSYLKKIKKDDLVLLKITDNMLSQYYDIHISPHVAILTSSVDPKLLTYQTHNNFIVASDDVVDNISNSKFSSRAKILRTRPGLLPADFRLDYLPRHISDNAALIYQTVELFKVPSEITQNVLQSFSGLRGRLELVKKVSGVEYYNDAYSVSPSATIVAIRELAKGRKIVLIMGGAYTEHDYSSLIGSLNQYVHTIILLPGSGTIGLRRDIESIEGIKIIPSLVLEEAVNKSIEITRKGDIVLFSPAFDALGVDISRKERSEKFVKYVRAL